MIEGFARRTWYMDVQRNSEHGMLATPDTDCEYKQKLTARATARRRWTMQRERRKMNK